MPRVYRPKTYIKKPVQIEAVEMPSSRENNGLGTAAIAQWVREHDGDVGNLTPEGLEIITLEGTHLARWGDFVIKGVKGEFYPCKPDIFRQTYDGPTPPVAPKLQSRA